MKHILYNFGYFIRETKTILRMYIMSYIFCFVSIGFISYLP